MGVIFNPGTTQTMCAFPSDGNTQLRKNAGPAKLSKLPPRCGVPAGSNSSDFFACNLTPEAYAAKFFNYPLDKWTNHWMLEQTCHFAGVEEMLKAERALLERCLTAPPHMTEMEWSERLEYRSAPTLWNEVVIGPHDASAVGGLFWAHKGPFRQVQEDRDCEICRVAHHFKKADMKIPVFELADFPFMWQFNLESLRSWNSQLHEGGYKFEDHFRQMDSRQLLRVLEWDKCKGFCSAL